MRLGDLVAVGDHPDQAGDAGPGPLAVPDPIRRFRADDHIGPRAGAGYVRQGRVLRVQLLRAGEEAVPEGIGGAGLLCRQRRQVDNHPAYDKNAGAGFFWQQAVRPVPHPAFAGSPSNGTSISTS
jgi:hypothetical protein